MTTADKMNIAGIALTCIGSTVAMAGVCFQTNGYFAVKPRHIFPQFFTVVWKGLRHGKNEAEKQLEVDARLGREKGEKHGIFLFGFYCVLFGFLLQMLGSGLLILALFANANSGAGHSTGCRESGSAAVPSVRSRRDLLQADTLPPLPAV